MKSKRMLQHQLTFANGMVVLLLQVLLAQITLFFCVYVCVCVCVESNASYRAGLLADVTKA